jgi:hypothetical protein
MTVYEMTIRNIITEHHLRQTFSSHAALLKLMPMLERKGNGP